MKTIQLQKNGVKGSPLTSVESIYDIYPFLRSSTPVGPWIYNLNEVELPYCINRYDGHTSSYVTGRTYTFTSTITIHKVQPTYLWFDYATQVATVYINNVEVGMYKGNYNSFTVDITNYITVGTNDVKVLISNQPANEGSVPIKGDFNYNATLGQVRLLTSPVLPDIKYGYDGFHIRSIVTASVATITIETSVPNYADVVCHIKDGEYNFTERKFGKGEISFTTTIDNPHLWNGKLDPHLYDVTLEIYYDGELCHKLHREYGFRFYEYVINDTEKVGDSEHPYTGFLLNGQKYLLRGVNTHHDVEYKGNALTIDDINNDFDIIRELGCNFLRLAHYPHPKRIYDYCDKLGIVVQTEIPWVNTPESDLGDTRKAAIQEQLYDMVMQHYNHPCIIFWGLANEITSGTAANTKTYLESLRTYIRTLDTSRLVGFVMSHSYNNPSSFGTPDLDWFGCNIYVGWYVDKTLNDPSNQINTRKTNFITNNHKPFAFSEYGCGGVRYCHSEDPWTTTTKGTNQPRHDIEYNMWLHEGHIAGIKKYPELIFSAMWMLFDIAVSNSVKREEGYTICLDNETTANDDKQRYLNNKGLVERDHKTKKDTFYIYKAWWSDEIFVHICQKNYVKATDRVIKCYSNDGSTFKLYVKGVNDEEAQLIETVTDVQNNIITFTARNYVEGDIITVEGETTSDSYTFTETFLHICGNDVIKNVNGESKVVTCYSNDGDTFKLYYKGVNDSSESLIETVTATDNIATFTSKTYKSGDVIRITGATKEATFTFVG